MDQSTLIAAFLGVLEGLTEFIPVSSTGHLLLAGHFLGFDAAGKTFEVVVQLGAVMAVLSIYFTRLWDVARRAPSDPTARRFIASILIAFMPAAVIGVLAHDIIKTVLFETPTLIAIMLILGGIILLFVDRIAQNPTKDDAMAFPLKMSFGIGLIQCLAMIPGVSRSGATIVGALLMGANKRSAAEFSFFLSMPTMLGAFTYDLWKNRDVLDTGAMFEIAVGLVAAFIVAILVVKCVLEYVSKHGYALFGWWRIIVGTVALAGLYLL